MNGRGREPGGVSAHLFPHLFQFFVADRNLLRLGFLELELVFDHPVQDFISFLRQMLREFVSFISGFQAKDFIPHFRLDFGNRDDLCIDDGGDPIRKRLAPGILDRGLGGRDRGKQRGHAQGDWRHGGRPERAPGPRAPARVG